MKKYFLVSVLLSIVLSSCTTIQNNQVKTCDWFILPLNTGLSLDGSTTFNLFQDNQRDFKWVYCLKQYDDLPGLNCANSTNALVMSNTLVAPSITSGVTTSLQLPAPYPNSKWIIADNGNLVHSVPIYHKFNYAFCLNSQEYSELFDLIIDIQTFDSPIWEVRMNSHIIWSSIPGTYQNEILNLIIPKNKMSTGINLLHISTIKQDLTHDEDFSDDNIIQTQYSALNVSGYIKKLRCCY